MDQKIFFIDQNFSSFSSFSSFFFFLLFFQGALDYVTGYAVTENGMIHCASRLYDANGTNIIGSSFYLIQPDDGSAKDFGTLKHNGNENDPALYGVRNFSLLWTILFLLLTDL